MIPMSKSRPIQKKHKVYIGGVVIVALVVITPILLIYGYFFTKHQPYTAAKAERLLEEAYDVDFTLTQKERVQSENKYKRYCYYFTAEDGTACTFEAGISKTYPLFGFPSWERYGKCDYMKNLILSHEKTLAQLCILSGLEYYHDDTFWGILVKTDEDVETASQLVYDMLKEVDAPVRQTKEYADGFYNSGDNSINVYLNTMPKDMETDQRYTGWNCSYYFDRAYSSKSEIHDGISQKKAAADRNE